MKKRIVALLPLIIIPFALNACKQDKASLTYGTLIHQDIYSLKEIDNSELASKSKDEKEVFILAVYQGRYSEECQCWTTFTNVIATYMNLTNEMVYLYNAHNQNDEVASLRINKYEDSTPTLYIFNGEKKVARFSYRNNGDKAIFEDTTAEAMKTRINRYIDKPTLYYVDEKYLDDHYTHDDSMAVLFVRRGCGDCRYEIPNVIIPYINKHKTMRSLCVFDIQDYYDKANKESATSDDKMYYQSLKDRFNLSTYGDETFGYQNGVVPTIQFVKKGVVDDASVYFNDTVAKKDDGTFYVSNSYYSEERLPHLKYLQGARNYPTILKGMTLTEGILENKKGGYYWSQDAASKYHRPLLEAFLDFYMFGY